MTRRSALAWCFKIAGVAIIVGTTAIAGVLLLLRHEHATAIELPIPTGHFSVGRSMFYWTNAAEDEAPAQLPASGRLVVWLWYPAVTSNDAVPADYAPAPWRGAIADRLNILMRSFFKRDLARVHSHSLSRAIVSPERATYPVVVIRPGGSALTMDFTALAEDLASHGYFVVGFDAPYRSFVVLLPDGTIVSRMPSDNVENAEGNLDDPLVTRLLSLWVSDTRFVVDQLQHVNDEPTGSFSHRMDLRRVGMIGHSFGGATALQFCHDDARCGAAVDLDGIPFGSIVKDGLAKPGMIVLSDHSKETDPSSDRIRAEMMAIYDRLAAPRLYAVIRNANHFSFTDQSLLNSQIVIRTLQRIVGFGSLDGRRGLDITSNFVHTFFDVSLNGASPEKLRDLAANYPEVQIVGVHAK